MRKWQIGRAVPSRSALLGLALALMSVGAVIAVVVVALDRPDRQRPVSVAHLVARAAGERTQAYLRHQERERERWLSSSAAKRQRASSQTAFHALGTAGSRALFARDFRADVAHVVANPAASPVVKNRVVRYLGTAGAVVSAGRRQRLVYSSVPLRVRKPGGEYAPVDLSVVRADGEYRAANPVQPVAIGGRLSAGVRIGRDGFGLTMHGADRSGGLAASDGVFYPRVATDVDASVLPTINGAEMFAMLRSRFSPQTLTYRLSLPRGATARLVGGLVLIRRGGKLVADVRPVTARDAQAMPVPVSEELNGDRLVVTVRHRAGSFAYPILVDPAADVPPSSTGWSFHSTGTGASETATGVSPGTVYMTGDGDPDEHVNGCWVWSMDTKYPVTYDEFDDMQAQVGPTVYVDPNSNSNPLHDNNIFGWNPGTWGSWDETQSPTCADASGIWWGFAHAPAAQYEQTGFGDERENETYSPPERLGQFGVVIDMYEQSGGAYPSESASSWGMLSVGAVLVETTYTTTTPLGGGGGGGPYRDTSRWSGPSNPSDPGQRRVSCQDPVNCATGGRFETMTDLDMPGRDRGLALTRTYNTPSLQVDPPGGTQPGGLAAPLAGDQGDPLAVEGSGDQGGTSTGADGGSADGSGDGTGLVAPSSGDAGGSTAVPPAPPLGMFGYGWTSSFSAHLTVDQTSGDATVYQDNGSTAAFTAAGGGFTPVDPLTEATLTQNADGSYTYTLPDQSTLEFDATGRLASEADPDGNTTTLSYDDQGRLHTITDAAGRSISLSYNTDGTVARAADSAGQQVSYGYTSGDLTSVTDVAGHVWTYGYNAAHDMTTNTDPLGHTVTTAYDAQNRVVSQTDAMGRTTTWSYSVGSAGYQTVETDASGNPTIYEFDDSFDPTTTTRSDGTSTFFYYDQNQNLTGVQDARGAYTSYTYDAARNMVATTNPTWDTTTWTYDGRHHMTSTTDPLGRTTTYAYQGNELTSITQTGATSNSGGGGGTTGGGGGGGGGCCVTASAYRFAPDKRLLVDPQFGYDANGDVTSMTDDDGNTWHYGYDAAGNRTSETTPEGETTTSSYDAAGYLTTTVNPTGGTTSYTNNAYGQPTDILDALGHATRLSYDAAGNLLAVTDADGHTTSYGYDQDDERTSTTQPDGTVTSTGYNSDGQIASQTDGAGNTTSYDHDDLGELTSMADPMGRTTSYAYDQAGDLTSMTDPDGRTTTFQYSYDDKVSSIYYSDGTPSVYYAYDVDGERVSMTDGSGWTGYLYNPLGRLISTTDGTGHTIGYGHDPNGNVTSVTYPNGNTIRRTFDGDGRFTSVTDWLGNTTTFGYDPDSNLTSTTFPSATSDVDSNTYNHADELTAIQMSHGASPLANLSYTLDPNGQVTSDTETGLPEPANQADAAYSYDSANNLNGASGNSYDQAGELTSSPVGTFSYDQAGERVAATPAAGGAATTYAYDAGGRLTTYTPAPGNPTTYAYNGDGLMTSGTHNSVSSAFTWDQTGSLPLILTDGRNSYIYGPDGLPVEEIDSQRNPAFLHHDQLGSTRLITGSSGNTTGAFSYDAYGQADASTGSATAPIGYAGQYTDPNTGLQYDRARYYDPTTGQFLTRDPLNMITGQPYVYSANSPVNVTDPTGMLSLFGYSIGFHPLAGLEGGANFAAGFADAAVRTVTLGNLGVPQPFCGGLLNESYAIGGWDMQAEAGVAGGFGVSAGVRTVLKGVLIGGVKLAPIVAPLAGGGGATILQRAVAGEAPTVGTTTKGVAGGLAGELATGFVPGTSANATAGAVGTLMGAVW